jgi:hypothetical protein
MFRGKKNCFVGYSLGRAQWESFVCLLMTGVDDKKSAHNAAAKLGEKAGADTHYTTTGTPGATATYSTIGATVHPTGTHPMSALPGHGIGQLAAQVTEGKMGTHPIGTNTTGRASSPTCLAFSMTDYTIVRLVVFFLLISFSFPCLYINIYVSFNSF